MRRVRCRDVLLLIVIIYVSVVTFLYVFDTQQQQEASEEELLQQKILELRERLQYAEQLHQERRRDLVVLRNQFSAVLRYNLATGSNSSVASAGHGQGKAGGGLSEQVEQLLGRAGGGDELQPPSIYDHMPHLVGNPGSLIPQVKISQDRSAVSLVMGIPTIHREKQNYLYDTLASLIDNISEDEVNDVLIVVMIAELNDTHMKHEVEQIKKHFSEHLKSGLLEVIVPPHSYYPNFTALKPTLGDSLERTQWRTKQNLDFAFLMMYAERKGAYYLQLEDDIITKPGYVTIIRKFILNQKSPDWLILEFSQLGFIGKLFRTSDIPVFIQFFLTFHSEKPVDWLLDDVFFVKACNPDIDYKKCQRNKLVIRKRFRPSLFQHIGLHSSLKGKNQKLKDKDFAKGMALHRPHMNPVAEVETSLKVYQDHSLQKCYLGETFFWGLLPQTGDYVLFRLSPPQLVERYYVKTGNIKHLDDKFFNTTFEIQFTNHLSPSFAASQNFTLLKDNFYVVNTFGETGIVHGNLSHIHVPVSEIRLRVLSESENWVIISEIHFQVFDSEDKKSKPLAS